MSTLLCRRLLCVLITLAVAGADAAVAQHHFYYFKEQRPLTLDVSRLAVRYDAAARGNGDLPKLDTFGIDDDGVKRLVIRDWHLAPVKQDKRSGEGVSQAVARISGDSVVDFVSPVFVGLDGGPVIVTPNILIGFDRDIDAARAEAILAEANAGAILDRDWANMKRAYRLKSTSHNGFDVLEAANRLAQLPEVRFAEPDMIFTGRGSFFPNDTNFNDCWGLHNTGQSGGLVDFDMDCPEAWDVSTGDPSILVLVLDNGVQQDHPDINQITPGIDTTSEAGDGGPVNECDNHGTWVAGCVSAKINNSLGVVGTCPNCRVASARPFISNVPCDGGWNAAGSWTVDALAWGEGQGVRVTNNSNSYGFTSAAIEAKYDDMRTNGIVHFSSAHNDGIPFISYPANLSSVNAVAASNRFGNRASFSNWGVGLAFTAPGQTIWTTDRTGTDGGYSGDYGPVNGTSFASPYTAGVAGLILSEQPGLNAFEVEGILQQSCVDLGDPGYDTDFGWGHINAKAALDLAAPAVAPCEFDKLFASDGAADDRFGDQWSVSIAGDLAVVGALWDDDNGSNSGSAYVFRWSPGAPGSWAQEQKLLPSDGATDDEFGYAVSISGDVVVVGARLDDDNGANSGSAYVFRYDASETTCGLKWCEEAKLPASDGEANDNFGISVSVFGDLVVVGARGDGDNGSLSGSAYVFRHDATETTCGQKWCQEQKLLPSDGDAGDRFGFWVSGFDGVCIVGAFLDEDNGFESGSAYVFRFDVSETVCGEKWCEEQKLLASDGTASDRFGNSVSIFGDVALVGAYLDDEGISNEGSAYLYRFDASETTCGVKWCEEQKLHASDGQAGDTFGASVSVAGDIAVVGAPGDDDNGSDSGSAYVYRFNGVTWVEQPKLTPSDGAETDYFGNSVSVSGEIALVGKPGDDDNGSNSGSAYFFELGPDCDRSGSPDLCDIRDGLVDDLDTDGIPDVCQCIVAEAPTLAAIGESQRFLPIQAGEAGRGQAVRVTFLDLPSPFDVWNDSTLWVGEPFDVSEVPSLNDDTAPTFKAARLQCGGPVFRDWSLDGVVNVYHEGIVPDGVYRVQVIDNSCDSEIEGGYSSPLDIVNCEYGDAVGSFMGGSWPACDESVDVAADALAVLDKFRAISSAPSKSRADIEPGCLDLLINISDALQVFDGFRGIDYPFTPSAADPCDSTCP